MKPKYKVGDVVGWRVIGGYCIGAINSIVILESGCWYEVPNSWLKKREEDLFLYTQENKSSGE